MPARGGSREREAHYAWPLRRKKTDESDPVEYVTNHRRSHWLNWALVPAAVALAALSLALSSQNRKVSQALEKQRQATKALLHEQEETNKVVSVLAAGDTMT